MMVSRPLLSTLLITTLTACGSGSSDDSDVGSLAVVGDDAVSSESALIEASESEETGNQQEEHTQIQEPQVQEPAYPVESNIELLDQEDAPPAGPCVDPDGDGYGWDGVASCTVLPATDTINTMQVPDDITQDIESVAIPYIDRYETYTLASWPAIQSVDALWPPRGEVVEATNGWTGVRNHPLVHVVLCENPDNTIDHPSIPGYFYDTAKGQTCSMSGTVTIPAPIEPVEFKEIGHEVLFDNGNQWNCRIESRLSMDTEFEATGETRTITYESGGTINSPWVPDYAYNYGFSGHASYDEHTITWYSTGLRRETCDRILDRNFPFNLYGEEKGDLYREVWNEFVGNGTPRSPEADLEVLSAVQVVDLPLECAHLSSTRDQRGGEVVLFYDRQTDVGVQGVGGNEYQITGFTLEIAQPDQLWTEDAEGGFTGPPNLKFYRHSEDLLIVRSTWAGPRGSSTQTTREYYACEVL